MKLFIVQTGRGTDGYREFIGNAETPEEIVLYAIARVGLDADTYVVYDHDLNRFEIPRPAPAAEG